MRHIINELHHVPCQPLLAHDRPDGVAEAEHDDEDEKDRCTERGPELPEQIRVPAAEVHGELPLRRAEGQMEKGDVEFRRAEVGGGARRVRHEDGVSPGREYTVGELERYPRVAHAPLHHRIKERRVDLPFDSFSFGKQIVVDRGDDKQPVPVRRPRM